MIVLTLFEKLNARHSLLILLATAVPMLLISKWSVIYWDLVLLDGIRDPEIARAILSGLTPEQVIGHIWFTVTIDVLLPFAVAGLFASAILLSFERVGPYLAGLVLMAIPIDLSEGIVQWLALTDTADLLSLKFYSTPVKKLCYDMGFLLSVFGLLKWLILMLKARFTE